MKHFSLLAAAILSAAICLLNACVEEDKQPTYDEYRLQCYEFLMENAMRNEVITTQSGLQYEVLREGDGLSPKASDRVRCHYKGWLIDGTVFDSSYESGEPVSFPLTGVIAGWREGLQLMRTGAKYRFYIPYTLGYGPSGYSSIPPYAALIFEVELIEVIKS